MIFNPNIYALISKVLDIRKDNTLFLHSILSKNLLSVLFPEIASKHISS